MPQLRYLLLIRRVDHGRYLERKEKYYRDWHEARCPANLPGRWVKSSDRLDLEGKPFQAPPHDEIDKQRGRGPENQARQAAQQPAKCRHDGIRQDDERRHAGANKKA